MYDFGSVIFQKTFLLQKSPSLKNYCCIVIIHKAFIINAFEAFFKYLKPF